MKQENTSRIPNFYNLTIDNKRNELLSRSALSSDEMNALSGKDGLTNDLAQHMIENVIGTFSLPMGIALNFIVNGRGVLVPMVVEEPSIVAGVSYMAKLARAAGGFTAHTSSSEMIGQIQILHIADVFSARFAILEQKEHLLQLVNEIDPPLQKAGGGGRDLEVRVLEHPSIGKFLVVHLIMDVCDAMGANAINTACEFLAPHLEAISGGKVLLRILSNLATRRLARVRCTIPLSELQSETYAAEEVRDGIIAAYAFAACDAYRAATHNKGIMNGVDAVLIATGNDWRAVEAGAHAYAARDGQYTSLSTWGKDAEGNLVGTLEMPLAVGIVGGATKVHPGARAALKLMGVTSAPQLAEIIVSVGLAQNLAALRALVSEGIQRGHMSLHARQVAAAAGAQGELITRIAQQLVAEKNIRIDRAEALLEEQSNTKVNEMGQ